jgi:hypothetical protein
LVQRYGDGSRAAPVRRPRRAGWHAIALGEAWPGAGALGSARPGERRKKGFVLPISYGITGLPALLFFNKGTVVDTVVGAVPKSVLQKHVDSVVNGA